MDFAETFNPAGNGGCQCWQPLGQVAGGSGAGGLDLFGGDDGAAGTGARPAPWWLPVMVSVLVAVLLHSAGKGKI